MSVGCGTFKSLLLVSIFVVSSVFLSLNTDSLSTTGGFLRSLIADPVDPGTPVGLSVTSESVVCPGVCSAKKKQILKSLKVIFSLKSYNSPIIKIQSDRKIISL